MYKPETAVISVETQPSIGAPPKPRSSAHIVTNPVDGCIYVFGGVGKNDALDDMHRYDPKARLWSEVRPGGVPPQGRAGASHVLFDNKWYFHSGRALRNYCSDVAVFDMQTLRWDSLKTQNVDGFFPSPRDDAGSCLWRDELLVFGGVSENGMLLQDLWSLHLPSLTWSCPRTHGAAPKATGALSLSLWPEEDTLVTFGGYDGEEFSNAVHLFDLPTARWKAADISRLQSPKPRTHAAVFVHGSALYVFAGYAGTEPQNDLWCLDLKAFVWTPVAVPQSTIPRGAPGFYHSNDSFVVFGGCTGGEFLNDIVRMELRPIQQHGANKLAALNSPMTSSPQQQPTPTTPSRRSAPWSMPQGTPLSIPRVDSRSNSPPPQSTSIFKSSSSSSMPALKQTNSGSNSQPRPDFDHDLSALQRAVDGLKSEVFRARSERPSAQRTLAAQATSPQRMLLTPRDESFNPWACNDVGVLRTHLMAALEDNKRMRLQLEEIHQGGGEARRELDRVLAQNERLVHENERLRFEIQGVGGAGEASTRLRHAGTEAFGALDGLNAEMDSMRQELVAIRTLASEAGAV